MADRPLTPVVDHASAQALTERMRQIAGPGFVCTCRTPRCECLKLILAQGIQTIESLLAENKALKEEKAARIVQEWGPKA